MKFSFNLSNVLGSVYHKGNVEFTPDGNCVLSPVGNKVISYDLKNSKCQAVPFEVEYNLNHLALSPNGSILLAATERTQLYICSMVSGVALHRKDFKTLGQINGLGFSPDGRFYVVLGGNKALVYITPGFAFKGGHRELSAFKIHRVFKAHYDETVCFSWSKDSRLLAIGSKDMSVKVFPVDTSLTNVARIINLSGHSDVVSYCYFASDSSNSLDLYTLSANAQICVWQATLALDELTSQPQSSDAETLNYSKKKRQYFSEDLKNSSPSVRLTASDYNSTAKLLVTGFSNGSFLLYEMPDITLMSSLQLSTTVGIDTVRFNRTADWIAIGSGAYSGIRSKDDNVSAQSQLVVWEWQSETFILKQSGTGSGVANFTECVCYSPDGMSIATGGTDGKIKLWNTFTNFCYATFSEEHKGPITCIEFVPNKGGKVLLSASLDGTVRAYDINRYRNFRTLTSPSDSKPAQFICLAVDSVGGDFIAAGSQNLFEIFLWSLQTGRMLECLTGHEGPVSGVKFSPTSNTLVSCSWDGTARIWDLFEGSKCTREIVMLGSDAMSLSFRPDGQQFAVATLNGGISFYDPASGEQYGVSIEGRADLEMSQSTNELVKEKEKYYTTINYSMDGEYVIAAGRSKFICIYHVNEKMLVKKFEVTWNLSMDGMYDYISKRKIAEFGFNAEVVSRREGGGEADMALPGVRKGDLSSRTVNPLIAVLSLQFSPTMRSFVASSTEGVLVYSLDNANNFDPYQLEENINEDSVRKAVRSLMFSDALMQSLKLNEFELIKEVFESVPLDEISFVSSSLPVAYVEKCIRYIAICLENTKHVEFFLTWAHTLLQQHGVTIKNSMSLNSVNSALRLLQRNLMKHFDDVGKLCDYNKYYLELIKVTGCKEKSAHVNSSEDVDIDDE